MDIIESEFTTFLMKNAMNGIPSAFDDNFLIWNSNNLKNIQKLSSEKAMLSFEDWTCVLLPRSSHLALLLFPSD